jgi:hypothetical protein
MVAFETTSLNAVLPIEDRVAANDASERRAGDRHPSARRQAVVARKPVWNRMAVAFGIACAVALGLVITLIGGLPKEDPWSPY